MNWIERPVPQPACLALQQAGLPDLLARLLAARGVRDANETDLALNQLLPPSDLKGIDAAARLLGQAVTDNLRICVVADYDCDGATACAVAIRGLRALGARQLNYVVPDRRFDGYGLTPGIAERVHAQGADVLVTVDNGIASVEGVQAARDLGLQVLVTDHHLPGPQLPEANALVNPNQPGCTFASKHLAGVGVMFYVLLATRAWLRDQGHFGSQGVPALDGLLPLVALGSVADVVTLDTNNRRLVHQGLERVRKGRMPAGMAALFEVCGRYPRQCVSLDFGFALAPRINAAGRMSTMGMGIECLLTDDPATALRLARELDQVNRDRRQVESGMLEQALTLAQNHLTADDTAPPALSLFDPQFHEGVIGIVAGRLKDRHHRPAFVFAPSHGQPGQVKGSGRSIPGFHLRDALDALSKRHPNLLLQFGGHAMAAGCTLRQTDLPLFGQALQQLASEWLDPNDLNHVWVTDGDLPLSAWNLPDFMALETQVWGSGFAPPLFCTEWRVAEQRVLGDKHLKLKLARGHLEVDGIWFGRTEALPETARLIYKPQINRWRGNLQMQVQVEALAEPAAQ
jgi:single-stranded-DNA-specific exonuclease